MTSSATYTTTINVDLPDYASGNVEFTISGGFFTSGNNETLPIQSYSLTLDGNGAGSIALPTPDNTGATAVNWDIVLPSGESVTAAISYSASAQELSDILASATTTTDVDSITASLANKLNNTTDTFDGVLTLTGDLDLDTDGGSTLDISDTKAESTFTVGSVTNRWLLNSTGAKVDSLGSLNVGYQLTVDDTSGVVLGSANASGKRVTIDGSETTISNTAVKLQDNENNTVLETTAGDVNLSDNTLTRPVIKDYGETVNAIGSIGGGTQDIDLTLGNVVSGTVDTSTTTFTFSNPPASGTAGSFTLFLTNGGSQTVNWPASVDWAGGTAPTLTSSGVDILTFTTIDGGTIWYGFAAGLDMQ